MNMCIPEPTEPLFQYWETFVHSADCNLDAVRRVIIKSWHRCVELGVDPQSVAPHDYLRGENLAAAPKAREKLINVARPFMTDLYTIVKGTGFVIVLTNEKGYILEHFGTRGWPNPL